MGPELIFQLRCAYYFTRSCRQKTIETFGYMPNIVYLNLKGFGITTLAIEGELREREFLFVFKGNRI